MPKYIYKILTLSLVAIFSLVTIPTVHADVVEQQWDFTTDAEGWKAMGLSQTVASGINNLDILPLSSSSLVWGWDGDSTIIFPTHSYKYLTFYVKGDWNNSNSTVPVTIKVNNGTQWYQTTSTISRNWNSVTMTIPFIDEQFVVDKVEYVFPNTPELEIDVDYVKLHWEPDND